MAIQKVLKTHLICPINVREAVLEKLQHLGFMQLDETSEETETTECESFEKLNQLYFIDKFLAEYRPGISLWDKLKKGLPVFGKEYVEKTLAGLEVEAEYKKLKNYDLKLKEINSRISECKKNINDLKGLEGINVSAEDLRSYYLDIAVIRLEKNSKDKLEENDKVLLEDITENISLLMMFRSSGENTAKLIKELDIDQVSLPPEDTAAESLKKYSKEIEVLEKEKTELTEEISSTYVDKYQSFDIALDSYENRLSREISRQSLSATKFMSIISGWIPEKRKNEFQKELSSVYPDIALNFSKPAPEDKPPVLLDNSDLNRPFELVTNLYGTCDYGWIDPTFIIAPFFTLFFGICLTDAGYGLVIALLSLWAIKKLKLEAGARNFMIIMLWGGSATVLAGALTGGWFGNALAFLPFLKDLQVLDPMENPDHFMYFSVFLGYIHVILGVMISVVKNIKAKEVKKALFEELPWVIVLLSAPLCFVQPVKSAGIGLAITGLLWILIFSGHEKKNPVARFFAGLGNIYGGTDYLKDMISYSRLFALGMGTGILAMAVNEISVLASGIKILGLPVGIIIMILIFVSGHIFNIVMSVLSAYIHTSRLQYVEFFKWFFKGGGSAFSPLQWKKRRFILLD